MASITYTYDTGQISHFAVIQADSDCNVDKNRTINVGVFCAGCKFRHSIKAWRSKEDDILRHYVFCTHPKNKDKGTATQEVRSWFVDKLEEEAMTAFYE